MHEHRETAPRERLWTPVFLAIVGATLCCFMVGQGLNSGTSVYLSLYGGTTAYAGVLAAVFSVAAAVARLVCGPLVDARGRRLVMVAGAALLIVGTAGPLVTHEGIAFAVFRFLQGVGFSAVTTASATAAADVLPSSRLGEGIGYYGLGQALSMSVGPALALFLVSTDPAENLFFGMLAAGGVSLALSVLCRYEKDPSRLPPTAAYRVRWEAEHAGRTADESAHTSSTERDAALLRADAPADSAPRGLARVLEFRALPGTLPMILLSPAFGFGIFFVGLYGTSLGVGSAGIFYTVSAVSMILVRLKSAAFMDRIAPLKVFAVAIACGIGGYALLLASGTALEGAGIVRDLLFYAAGIPYGLCLGIAAPLGQSVAVKATPPERWGAASALYLLATDVGIGAASVIWGLVNDALGFPATIVCVMCCIAASLAVAKVTYPKE